MWIWKFVLFFFFFQAEDGIRDADVTGVQTCALPISPTERAAQTGDPYNTLQLAWEVIDDGLADGGEIARLIGTIVGTLPAGLRPARRLDRRSRDELGPARRSRSSCVDSIRWRCSA